MVLTAGTLWHRWAGNSLMMLWHLTRVSNISKYHTVTWWQQWGYIGCRAHKEWNFGRFCCWAAEQFFECLMASPSSFFIGGLKYVAKGVPIQFYPRGCTWTNNQWWHISSIGRVVIAEKERLEKICVDYSENTSDEWTAFFDAFRTPMPSLTILDIDISVIQDTSFTSLGLHSWPS